MKIPCPFCGEVDTEKLDPKNNLWEIHKFVGGHQLYCPKCGKYMNLDHAIDVNSILHSVEINRG
jgi:sarcosine oxidase delta subunit